MQYAYDFVQFYQNDISSDLPRQLLSLKENLKNMKLKTIRDLSDFFLENDLCSVYSDIMTACIIFLTLPVTVASAERSFSKLKLIKNYLRNSTSQERLSHIAVLNIEKKKTQELNIDKIINDFAHNKARKKNFLK